MTGMVKIILASGSPRRQELLGRIGVKDFEVVVPQVEETYPAGLNPEETMSGNGDEVRRSQ